MADSEDIEILKRRGRRRLLGAIALVLLAVIVLPMVFDQEPREASAPVSVRIPGEEAAPLVPKSKSQAVPQKVLPAAEGVSESPAKSAQREPAGQSEAQRGASEAAKPGTAQQTPLPVASAATEPPKAKASGTQFIIPVVALANRDKVREVTDLLAAAKLPYYTEPVSTAKGSVTRVRVGPYDRREAAERAHRKLKELGLTPGAITTRSG